MFLAMSPCVPGTNFIYQLPDIDPHHKRYHIPILHNCDLGRRGRNQDIAAKGSRLSLRSLTSINRQGGCYYLLPHALSAPRAQNAHLPHEPRVSRPALLGHFHIKSWGSQFKKGHPSATSSYIIAMII